MTFPHPEPQEVTREMSELPLAVFEQVAGLAVEDAAEGVERVGREPRRGLVARELVRGRDGHAQRFREGVGGHLAFGEDLGQVPSNRHGLNVPLVSPLDNTVPTLYYSPVHQRGETMKHPVAQCERINSSIDYHGKSYSYRYECPVCKKGRRWNANFMGNRFAPFCDGDVIERRHADDARTITKKRRAWSDEQVIEAAREIDSLQLRSERVIERIEASGHPDAAAIGRELRDQCFIAASAREVAQSAIDDAAWVG